MFVIKIRINFLQGKADSIKIFSQVIVFIKKALLVGKPFFTSLIGVYIIRLEWVLK